jgi:hypothetical protein
MLKEQLTVVAQRMQAEQGKRDALVSVGRRAYRMGIELRDNPRNVPSERKLWEEGWTKEARDFGELLKRIKQ